MIKIQPRINISKPSFTANRYIKNTNLLQNDEVNFSNKKKDDTQCSITKKILFAAINVFSKIIQHINDLFGENKKEDIKNSTKYEEPENTIEIIELTPEEIEKQQEEIRKSLEIAAEKEKIKRRMEAELKEEIKDPTAKQKPMFTEYNDEELKDMFNQLENGDSALKQSRFKSMI